MNNTEYKAESLATVRVAEVICQIRLDEVATSLREAQKLGPHQDPELFAKSKDHVARQLRLVEALIEVRKARWEMNLQQTDIINDANAEAGAQFLEMLRA